MVNVNRTANGHQTSLLVREHIPEFVIADHPKFVTFIEKYYEFMANNTLMATTSNSSVYYYGADTASKILQDIRDVDKTDFDKFVEMFRRQYAYSFPKDIYSDSNRATLYKNLVNFYQAVGTEDSFKMLFRLLYNDEIELYYPQRDILVASGGSYVKQARVRVNYVDGLNGIENKKIVGANSGAYGTVERVEVLAAGSDTFASGRIANTSTTFGERVLSSSNTNPSPLSVKYDEVNHPEKQLEQTRQVAHLYLSDYFGTFDIAEEVYYSDGDSANTIVCANTIILPVMKRLLLFDSYYQPETANAVVSVYDARSAYRATSTNPPWGQANVVLGLANTKMYGNHIFYSNTGFWHTTGEGQGEITLTTNSVYGSYGGKVLQIGNNSVGATYGDYRQLVYSRKFGYGGDSKLYRLTVRARDIGGNAAHSVVTGNRFSAGIVAYDTAERIIQSDKYTNPLTDESSGDYSKAFWLASDSQSIDDEFYNYVAYFKGREKSQKKSGVPLYEYNRGSGGRQDLPSGTRYYNSLQKALDGGVKLPYGTLWFTPTIRVNEAANGATYSQGITQIDYVALDELSSMQKQEGARPGSYRDDSSSLLSSSSRLYDGNYWQEYAYDIRSKKQVSDYKAVVRDSVHPAGMKMFGTKIHETSANGSYKSTQNNSEDTFSPDQLDSLAGWWRADAIGPQNIVPRKLSPTFTGNGVFGSIKNYFPIGFSDFEESPSKYSDFLRYGFNSPYGTGTVTTEDSYIGSSSFKFVDEQINAYPLVFDFPNKDPKSYNLFNKSLGNRNLSDFQLHPIVIEPYKKWVFSVYSKTNNVASNNPNFNSFAMYVSFANTSGSQQYGSGTAYGNGSFGFAYFPHYEKDNEWKRMAMLFDFSDKPNTRIAFRLQTMSRRYNINSNTHFFFDGFMLEEYDPSIHDVEGSDWPVPSPYVRPDGMNGANVISWFDQSVNRHHVYANTHGGLYYHPQYISNAINGKPAIRFSANTVKNAGNVYQYSSIGGSSDSIALNAGTATNFKPSTSGFQSKISSNSSFATTGGTLANPSLPRPVSNTWTIMAVVKSNMAINATSYNELSVPTIINSGYANNTLANIDRVEGGTAFGTLNLGYNVNGQTGSLQTHVVNSLPGVASVNTTHVAAFNSLSSPATNNTFRIVGVSVNASTSGASSVDDLLNFHIDGRRFSNPEINNISNLSPYTGMFGSSQKNYVTSIGKWKPANTRVNVSDSVYSNYPYGTRDWDGDIAEILVFNDKLSNNNISKVEGYLAHKYRLQANLKHKDDTGSGSSEIVGHRWEFSNTADGWTFYDTNNSGIDPTLAWVWEPGEANGAIHVTAPGSTYYMGMKIDLKTPIDGSAYNKFAIRFNTVVPPTTLGIGSFAYKNSDGATFHFPTPTLGDAAVKTTGWHEHYVDLSSDTNWVGKKITNLTYLFDTDIDGGQEYYVDWVYLSGEGHPHPYRYSAPPAFGANSWNTNY